MVNFLRRTLIASNDNFLVLYYDDVVRIAHNVCISIHFSYFRLYTQHTNIIPIERYIGITHLTVVSMVNSALKTKFGNLERRDRNVCVPHINHI